MIVGDPRWARRACAPGEAQIWPQCHLFLFPFPFAIPFPDPFQTFLVATGPEGRIRSETRDLQEETYGVPRCGGTVSVKSALKRKTSETNATKWRCS